MMVVIRRVFVWVVFTSLRLLLLGVQRDVSATILLRTGNYTFTPIPDVAADFGLPVPLEGISGHVLTVEPEDACADSISPMHKKDVREYHSRDGLGWIALVKRSEANGEASNVSKLKGCSFEHKVKVATKAGASAVIVYDVVYEGLITMSTAEGRRERDTKKMQNLVPSVFVSKESGALLRALIASSGLVQVIITPVSNMLDMWTSLVMSLVAGCFAMSLVMGAMCMVRYGSRGYMDNAAREEAEEASGDRHRERMMPLKKRELRHLTRVEAYRVRADSSIDEEATPCSICLEVFEAGEKVRTLPCGHVFHRDCVDEWLLRESRLCPMCKRSVVDAAQVDMSAEEGAVRRFGWARVVDWWQRRRTRNDTGREQELSVLLDNV